MKSDIKAPSCAAIFRLGIVVLQCVRAGEVFCDLHVAHVHIICPVRDVTHVRKCTRPSPALPYYKRQEAGRGPGNEASTTWQKLAQVPVKCKNRGGAGISKVVRPLHIKDDLCMCKEGGGGGEVYNR